MKKMAYEFNDLKGFLFLVLITIPLTSSTDINCHGKPFHCLNTTHFMICVELGGGISTTIDDFVIPCPDATECHASNLFECEYPKVEIAIPTLDVIGISGTKDITAPSSTSDATEATIILFEKINDISLPSPEEISTSRIEIFEELNTANPKDDAHNVKTTIVTQLTTVNPVYKVDAITTTNPPVDIVITENYKNSRPTVTVEIPVDNITFTTDNNITTIESSIVIDGLLPSILNDTKMENKTDVQLSFPGDVLQWLHIKNTSFPTNMNTAVKFEIEKPPDNNLNLLDQGFKVQNNQKVIPEISIPNKDLHSIHTEEPNIVSKSIITDTLLKEQLYQSDNMTMHALVEIKTTEVPLHIMRDELNKSDSDILSTAESSKTKLQSDNKSVQVEKILQKNMENSTDKQKLSINGRTSLPVLIETDIVPLEPVTEIIDKNSINDAKDEIRLTTKLNDNSNRITAPANKYEFTLGVVNFSIPDQTETESPILLQYDYNYDIPPGDAKNLDLLSKNCTEYPKPEINKTTTFVDAEKSKTVTNDKLPISPDVPGTEHNHSSLSFLSPAFEKELLTTANKTDRSALELSEKTELNDTKTITASVGTFITDFNKTAVSEITGCDNSFTSAHENKIHTSVTNGTDNNNLTLTISEVPISKINETNQPNSNFTKHLNMTFKPDAASLASENITLLNHLADKLNDVSVNNTNTISTDNGFFYAKSVLQPITHNGVSERDNNNFTTFDSNNTSENKTLRRTIEQKETVRNALNLTTPYKKPNAHVEKKHMDVMSLFLSVAKDLNLDEERNTTRFLPEATEFSTSKHFPIEITTEPNDILDDLGTRSFLPTLKASKSIELDTKMPSTVSPNFVTHMGNNTIKPHAITVSGGRSEVYLQNNNTYEITATTYNVTKYDNAAQTVNPASLIMDNGSAGYNLELDKNGTNEVLISSTVKSLTTTGKQANDHIAVSSGNSELLLNVRYDAMPYAGLTDSTSNIIEKQTENEIQIPIEPNSTATDILAFPSFTTERDTNNLYHLNSSNTHMVETTSVIIPIEPVTEPASVVEIIKMNDQKSTGRTMLNDMVERDTMISNGLVNSNYTTQQRQGDLSGYATEDLLFESANRVNLKENNDNKVPINIDLDTSKNNKEGNKYLTTDAALPSEITLPNPSTVSDMNYKLSQAPQESSTTMNIKNRLIPRTTISNETRNQGNNSNLVYNATVTDRFVLLDKLNNGISNTEEISKLNKNLTQYQIKLNNSSRRLVINSSNYADPGYDLNLFQENITKIMNPYKITNNNTGNSTNSVSDFECSYRIQGKYADSKDCRKYYTCAAGSLQPIIYTCPNDTVFSEITKQCTRDLSHCVRNNTFYCLYEGHFSDLFKDNIYYICVKNNLHGFIRYVLQCQGGYHLNKDSVKCEKNAEITSHKANMTTIAENNTSSTWIQNKEPLTLTKNSNETSKENNVSNHSNSTTNSIVFALHNKLDNSDISKTKEVSKSYNKLLEHQNMFNDSTKKHVSNLSMYETVLVDAPVYNMSGMLTHEKITAMIGPIKSKNESITGKHTNAVPVFDCSNRTRGKYADSVDCRKYYICVAGSLQPIVGTCPNNTVFSEINKQCTRNLSHCVRNNQFHCINEGRFSDFFKDNIYYICLKNNSYGFKRYKLSCQKGYHLNKVSVVCDKNVKIFSESVSSVSENSNTGNNQSGSKIKDDQNKTSDEK